jgi:hypothetical protein
VVNAATARASATALDHSESIFHTKIQVFVNSELATYGETIDSGWARQNF